MERKGSYFSEVQYYKTAWIWLIPLLVESILFAIMIVNYDALSIKKFSLEDLYIMLGIFSIMFLGLYFLFKYMYIAVVIDKRGVGFKAPPFIRDYKFIDKSEILYYKVRNYNYIKEIGSRGYKPNANKSKVGLTMEGDIGLEIKTTTNKTFIFGTMRKSAITFAMNKLMERS